MKFNDLALEIAQIEGKKESENIAQIREQLSITLRLLRQMPMIDLIELLAEGGKK